MQPQKIAEISLALIVLLPFAGAIFNGLSGRFSNAFAQAFFGWLPGMKPSKQAATSESRRVVVSVAVGAVLLAFFAALYSFYWIWHEQAEGRPAELSAYLFHWLSLKTPRGVASIDVRFTLDPLNGVMALVVTGIGTLIHLYSAGYMSDEPSYARFFTYLNLFTASMLILILGDSLPIMFVGWEGVGLCSYLLIGFWWKTPEYAAAGKKAFLYNRVGDFGVLLGMFFILAYVGALDFKSINQAASMLGNAQITFNGHVFGLSVASLIALCLFLGCTGKSAQLPLFVWLPDAMAGPTPVSALIHAATMVTAGIYLMCRLSPVFLVAPHAMAVIALVGALTALVAASIALVQGQLKKILAYSTVSQLGFMVAAAGVGAFTAGFFHVFTHAFFKACLFLGAGSVMHAVGAHGDASLKELGGLRKIMPTTHWTFLVSCLAIAGVPGLSGFFSKDEILLGAAMSSHYFTFAPWLSQVIFGMLLVTAAMTAFYMFRLYFMTFSGTYRGGASHGHHDDHHGHDHGHHGAAPHESPITMTLPLVVLAIGAIVVGYLGTPHFLHVLPNYWSEWLAPVVASAVGHEADATGALTPAVVMALGTAAALVGVWVSWLFYGTGEPSRTVRNLAQALPSLRVFLEEKWRLDPLYDFVIIRPAHALAELFALLDRIVVDGMLTRLTAALTRVVAYVLTRMQTGFVHAYLAMMVLGVGWFSWWFVYPHARVDVRPTGDKVVYATGQGFGYSTRLDYDDDGVFDTPWLTSPEQLEHDFAEGAYAGLVVRVTALGAYHRVREYQLNSVGSVVIDEKLLGEGWGRSRSDLANVLPVLKRTRTQLVLLPNGAAVGANGLGEAAADKAQAMVLRRGDHFRLGGARVDVGVRVRSAMQVRNIFGYVKTKQIDIVLYREAFQQDAPGDVPGEGPDLAQQPAPTGPLAGIQSLLFNSKVQP